MPTGCPRRARKYGAARAAPAARAAQARLAPMPSAAFSHTTISQPSVFRCDASSSAPGLTTAKISWTADRRCRAACTAIDTPCGSAWRSLSEPKRLAEPAASSSPTIFNSGLDFAGRRIEAALGLRGPARLGDAVAHRGHLGEDRDRDLGRGLGADVQPHRPAQAGDLVRGQVELAQPLAARIVVFLRADRADVERRRF